MTTRRRAVRALGVLGSLMILTACPRVPERTSFMQQATNVTATAAEVRARNGELGRHAGGRPLTDAPDGEHHECDRTEEEQQAAAELPEARPQAGPGTAPPRPAGRDGGRGVGGRRKGHGSLVSR